MVQQFLKGEGHTPSPYTPPQYQLQNVPPPLFLQIPSYVAALKNQPNREELRSLVM